MSSPRTRQSRQFALLLTLLCLAILFPLLPLQSALASPGSDQPSRMQAQDATDPLIAFLRQGDLWLMSADGLDQRQITDYEWGVRQFSWSPSGRYLLIAHGGLGWHWTMWRDTDTPDRLFTLYDVTTGELRDLTEVSNAEIYLQARFPVWAENADELLMEVVEQTGNYSLVRIGLDGSTSQIATYQQPPTCGGQDGPMTITRDLLWEQEFGSPWARDAYQGIIWWSDRDVAFVNTECGPGISLNLVTGEMVEYPESFWLAAGPDGRILLQDYALVGGLASGVFDPGSGVTTPIPAGEVLAWGPDGAIYSSTVTQGATSAFSSEFDDFSGGYTDNTVEMWESASPVGERRLVASLDAYGTGVPNVTADNSGIIMGVVDNPTALMDVDTSQYSEYSPEVYAEHQKVIRVETETGEVTVLATNAYRPRIQPGESAISETSTPVPDEAIIDPNGAATPIAEAPTSPEIGSTEEIGGGWIAFTGADGNIWLTRPDGSELEQVTTDGTTERPYIDPSWSPDGTMLVFSTRNGEEVSGNDIYLLHDGTITRVPNVSNCSSAAFTADGMQLALLCGTFRNDYPDSISQTDLNRSPDTGYVSLVDFDGSNWRVLAPFPLQRDGQNTLWWNMLYTYDVDVSLVDGEILVNRIFWSSARSRGISLISQHGDWNLIINGVETPGRIWGEFASDGTHVLTSLCHGCYNSSTEQPNNSLLLLDRTGKVVSTLHTPAPDVLIGSFSQSPDGSSIVMTTTTEETDLDLGTPGLPLQLQLLDVASGDVTALRLQGGDVAWQPVDADLTLPQGTVQDAPDTPEAEYEFAVPVFPYVCSKVPTAWLEAHGTYEEPPGCSLAANVTAAVTGPAGEAYGSCTTNSAGGSCAVYAASLIDLTVTLDESTIPSGYTVLENPVMYWLEDRPVGGDAATFIMIPESDSTIPVQTTEDIEIAEGDSGSSLVPGSDWIAYVRDDGNIWLMQPDGSGQMQITTDGTPDLPYMDPSWSHDGTILAFGEYPFDGGEDGGIWLLRGGQLAVLPNTRTCLNPAFSSDNQRLFYTCPTDVAPGDPVPSDLLTNPLRGFVTSSNLDGSDQRVEIPYTTDGTGIAWTNDTRALHFAGQMDVRTSDDMVMVVYSGFHKAGVHLFAADRTLLNSFELYGSISGTEALGPYDARFTPDGQGIIATVCTSGCYPPYESPKHDLFLLDLQGNIIGTWTESYPGHTTNGVDVSPDGSRVVTAYRNGDTRTNTMLKFDAATQWTQIGAGSQPAWQPNPGVVAEPLTPSSGAEAPDAESAVIEPSGLEPGTVDVAPSAPASLPDAYLGGWEGRGTQVNPSVEWPVTITLNGGAEGEVIGTSAYPNDGCGGNLILQNVTADAIVLIEHLTYGQDACTDGGTITLDLIDNAALSFDWAGVRADGSASSATGTLYSTGDATISGDGTSQITTAPDPTDTDLVDTPEPQALFVGTWEGTGTQTNPITDWPITISLTGGQPGEIIGTVDYPSLSCGGELTLLATVESDAVLAVDVAEHITYGEANCIDGGTFRLSQAGDGSQLAFQWTSPDGTTTAEGILNPT